MSLERWRENQIENSSCGVQIDPIEREKSKEPLYKTLSAPLEVQVELTTACDRSCIHCYNYWRGEESFVRNRVLSSEEITSIVDQLERNRIFSLTVSGGEPLLFKRRAFRLMEEATQRGIDCSLNSNLFSLTPDDALRLKDISVRFILASLPSVDPQTHDFITQCQGSFNQTLRGIEALLEAEVKVGVNMVISKFNQGQIYETGRFLKSLGVDHFFATKASPPLNSREFAGIRAEREAIKDSLVILRDLSSEFGMATDILECYPLCLIGDVERFEKFTRHKCRGGITSATIGADGELRPCSHSDQTYGNIFRESLEKAWLDMDEWRDGSLVPETCLSCEHFRRCSGGCRMEAKYYGKINGMDPFATGPEDVILPKVEKTQDSDLEEIAKDQLEVFSGLKTRKESFGGILKGKGTYVFVNEALWKLVGNIRPEKVCNAERVSWRFGLEKEEVLRIFSYLHREGILEKLKKGGGEK